MTDGAVRGHRRGRHHRGSVEAVPRRPRAGHEAAPRVPADGVVRDATVVVVDALVHAALLEREVGGQAQDLTGGAVKKRLRHTARAGRRSGSSRRPRDEVLDL